MIEVNEGQSGATIAGKFYRLAPRLAKALAKLVKGPTYELLPGKNNNNQKVCANQLRNAIAGSGYTVIFSERGYTLIEEIRNANA